jgi:hypothetical protein
MAAAPRLSGGVEIWWRRWISDRALAAIASGPQCRADLDDDIDESSGPEHAAHPVHAARKLPPCPRRETSVERRASIGVHRAIGESGDEPPARRDE